MGDLCHGSRGRDHISGWSGRQSRPHSQDTCLDFSRSQHSAMLHICFLDSQLQDLLAAGADSQTVPPPVL